MKEIATALVKAQKAFGPALKTKTNPHLRSKYADLAAVIEAVCDALNDNGIMFMQLTHDATDGVVVETMFVHESGETMSAGRLHIVTAKFDPQGFGSALTYARRYSLMAACGIAPEDDDAEGVHGRHPKDVAAAKKKPELPPAINADQAIEISDLIKETKSDVEGVFVWIDTQIKFKPKSIEEIPSVAYVHLVKMLKKKLEPKKEGTA
jgi:hypothetical protein